MTVKETLFKKVRGTRTELVKKPFLGFGSGQRRGCERARGCEVHRYYQERDPMCKPLALGQ